MSEHVRKFDTGAMRDKDDNKLDYEAFLSPTVMLAFSQYMHKHRKLPDGSMRDGDNWQKGIPLQAYQKSLFRHVMQAWTLWRGYELVDDKDNDIELEETLCAILFNTQGMLHELIKLRMLQSGTDTKRE